ncbi:MAG: hypothetical protein IKC01_02535 [Clostridia bacterium]|nr:hypothetical protein [Clostridia bacterium]
MLDKLIKLFTAPEFIESLLCSAAGMAGIFIVVGIIILSIVLLNKFGSMADNKNKE